MPGATKGLRVAWASKGPEAMVLERFRGHTLSKGVYQTIWAIIIALIVIEAVLLYFMVNSLDFFGLAMVLTPMIILTGTAVLIFLGNYETEPPRPRRR